MTQKQQLQSAGDGTAVPAGYQGETKSSSTLVGSNLVNSSTLRSIVQVTGVTKGVYLVLGCVGFDSASVADGYVNLDLCDGTTGFNAVRSYSRISTTADGFISTFSIINVTIDNTTLSTRISRSAGQMYINTQLIQAIRIA